MTIRNLRAFKKDGIAALKGKGLRFIVCKVEESLVHREIRRPTIDLAENKYDSSDISNEPKARPSVRGARLKKVRLKGNSNAV